MAPWLGGFDAIELARLAPAVPGTPRPDARARPPTERQVSLRPDGGQRPGAAAGLTVGRLSVREERDQPLIARRPATALAARRAPERAGVATETRWLTHPATAARADWPVLGALRHLAQIRSPGEPAALQVLRRMAPAAAARAATALAALPALGPGEPLADAVRGPMEQILGRSFGGVRVHQAPVAAMLQAEAFTTGERIVFAPGAFDPRSARGLALIGHELAHVGQALAFKQVAGSDLDVESAEERDAERQERLVQRIVERGWPEARAMEVRRPPAPVAGPEDAERRLARAAAGGAGAASAAPLVAQRSEGTVSTGAADQDRLPMARLAEQPAPAPEPPAATGPDLDRLARQVYVILKAQLRAERDRHYVH